MFEEFELDPVDDLVSEAEADGIFGLKPPRENPLCIGHDAIEQQLLDIYNKNKIPHSIVLTGAKGIGKATLAYRLARFMLNDDQGSDALFGGDDFKAESLVISEDSIAFQKVASGSHPDLRVIERSFDETKGAYKGALLVDNIREILKFTQSTASMGGWRICIIDDADTMNVQAQNALLKILEEPPHKTLIILVAHRMGRFLPTIRSRLRVFQLSALNINDFNELIAKYDVNTRHKNIVYALSRGSIGAASEIIESDTLDVIDKFFACLKQAQGKIYDPVMVYAFSDQLNGKGKDRHYDFYCNFMGLLSKSLVNAKVCNDLSKDELLKALSEYQRFDSLAAFFDGQSLQYLLKIHDAMREHLNVADKAYLDKRYVITQSFEILTGNI